MPFPHWLLWFPLQPHSSEFVVAHSHVCLSTFSLLFHMFLTSHYDLYCVPFSNLILTQYNANRNILILKKKEHGSWISVESWVYHLESLWSWATALLFSSTVSSAYIGKFNFEMLQALLLRSGTRGDSLPSICFL